MIPDLAGLEMVTSGLGLRWVSTWTFKVVAVVCVCVKCRHAFVHLKDGE